MGASGPSSRPLAVIGAARAARPRRARPGPLQVPGPHAWPGVCLMGHALLQADPFSRVGARTLRSRDVGLGVDPADPPSGLARPRFGIPRARAHGTRGRNHRAEGVPSTPDGAPSALPSLGARSPAWCWCRAPAEASLHHLQSIPMKGLLLTAALTGLAPAAMALQFQTQEAHLGPECFTAMEPLFGDPVPRRGAPRCATGSVGGAPPDFTARGVHRIPGRVPGGPRRASLRSGRSK